MLLHSIANDRYGSAMPRLLKIADKDNNPVPFVPTMAHRKLTRNRKRINYWVKPRQVWATSFSLADTFLDCTEGNGVKALFINLNSRVTKDVFSRVHKFIEHFPVPAILPRLKKLTGDKLEWANGATFDAITVNNEGGEGYASSIGRSCTVQRVHVTEAAYMRHYREFMTGLEESLPKLPSCSANIESTGNGAQGGFWEDCIEIYENGEQVEPNVWVLGNKSLNFIAWWEHNEYTSTVDVLPDFVQFFEPRHQKLWDENEREHREIMERDKSLSPEFIEHAIYWRRAALLNKGFLKNPEQAIAVMDQEYPGTLLHAFQSTGSAFFSLSQTSDRFDAAKKYNKESRLPLACRIVNIGGHPHLIPGGDDILMWDAPYDPSLGRYKHRYCIGSDVGGGGPDSDPDAIWVKDRLLNRYVAVCHARLGPARHAQMLLDLAKIYHDADISFECNNHGTGVQIKMWEFGYEHVYKYDPEAEGYRGYGFHTNESTRNNGLHYFRKVYEDQTKPLLIHYEQLYSEMRTFRSPPGRTPTGEPKKPVAAPGKNDDLIMGMMVCEALDAILPPCERFYPQVTYDQTQLGYLKNMAINGHSGGLSNVL